MRSRLFAISLSVLSAVAAFAPALGAQTDQYADGLTPGDYLRIGGGVVSPVNAQGSVKDWQRGNMFSLAWENWQPGSGGVGHFGFGITGDFSRMPFNEHQFISEFTPVSGGTVTSANASSAVLFQIGTNLRYRFSSPFAVPMLELGFGYLDFNPGSIHYTATTGSSSVSERHRRGAALSIGAGLDKQIVNKVGIFGEALYTYGFTSLGYGFQTPGGTCLTSGCDVLKNTALGIIRGGLRVQTGR